MPAPRGTIDGVGRDEIVASVARAALLGARGNSGVILSQLIRGAAEELASRPGELVDPVLISAALARAADQAYGSVREPVEGTQLLLQEIGLAADDSVGIRFEAVELEVQCRSHLVELLQKAIIACDSLAVGIDHDEADIAGLGGANEVDDPRVDRRLAAGKLDDLRIAFGADIVVEHLFDFLERQAESLRGGPAS